MLVMAPQIRAAFPVSFRGGKKTTHNQSHIDAHLLWSVGRQTVCVDVCVTAAVCREDGELKQI